MYLFPSWVGSDSESSGLNRLDGQWSATRIIGVHPTTTPKRSMLIHATGVPLDKTNLMNKSVLQVSAINNTWSRVRLGISKSQTVLV